VSRYEGRHGSLHGRDEQVNALVSRGGDMCRLVVTSQALPYHGIYPVLNALKCWSPEASAESSLVGSQACAGKRCLVSIGISFTRGRPAMQLVVPLHWSRICVYASKISHHLYLIDSLFIRVQRITDPAWAIAKGQIYGPLARDVQTASSTEWWPVPSS
jgi:hypothetical protein